MLMFFLSLRYVCTAFEMWLAISSDAIPFPQMKAFEGSVPLMAHQVNKTCCSGFVGESPLYGNLCGVQTTRYDTIIGACLWLILLVSLCTALVIAKNMTQKEYALSPILPF
jgi:hypothetical protein